MTRFLLAGVMFATLFLGEPWVVFAIALLLSLRWVAWEVAVAGLLMDMLYLPAGGVYGIPYISTLVSLILLWSLVPIRQLIEENVFTGSR